MKIAVLLPMMLCALAGSSFAKEFKLYAEFTQDTRVELSDGAIWQMDKGDVFPIQAYKDQQKNIVLKLAGATFMTETSRTRVLKPGEVAAGLEIYRKNVRAYLDSTAKKLEQKLVATQEEKTKEKEQSQAAAKAAETPEPKAEEKTVEPKPDPVEPAKKAD